MHPRDVIVILASAGCASLTAVPAAPRPVEPVRPVRDATPDVGAAPMRGEPLAATTRTPASIPEAPQQHAAWVPPDTQLAPTLVSAVDTLFEQGLADPRGCEYRSVDLAVGDAWTGGPTVARTHAFVLPPRPHDSRQWAVSWSGLVYATLAVGARSDLSADVRAMITRWSATRGPGANATRITTMATNEASDVAVEFPRPLRVAMLLRLGEVSLAETLESALRDNGNDNRSGTASSPAPSAVDPYIALARDWTWSRFDRAICAHMRADDALALADFRAISTIERAIDSVGARRGIPHERSYRPNGGSVEVPYLPFVDDVPALLADHERRARDTEPRADPDSIPESSARVAARIRALEEINARQLSQPGGVMLALDPRARALEREGPEAIGPVIEALEHDERLTRSVTFFRDFVRDRHAIPVADVALEILPQLLGEELSGGWPPDHHAAAAQARAIWDRIRGMAPERQFYGHLMDDQAGAAAWLQAAQNVVNREASSLSHEVIAPDNWLGDALPGRSDQGTMRGEPLRSTASPRVSDLLTRRIGALEVAADWGRVCAMTSALWLWDPAAARPVVRRLSTEVRAALARVHLFGDDRTLPMCFVALTIVRTRGGDRRAVADYAAWVQRLRPEDFGDGGSAVINTFYPLAEYADDPRMARAVERLFGPTSTWLPLVRERDPLASTRAKIFALAPGLLPALRRHHMAMLRDTTTVGSVSVTLSREVVVTSAEGTSYSAAPDDDVHLAIGTRPLRRCDVYAQELVRYQQVPERFELFWDLATRDAVIARAGQTLAHPR